jgi:hypothetical protein
MDGSYMICQWNMNGILMDIHTLPIFAGMPIFGSDFLPAIFWGSLAGPNIGSTS